MGSEFRCPNCGAFSMKIMDSRFTGNYRRRRRECLICNDKITTYEVYGNQARKMSGVVSTEKLKLIELFNEFIDSPDRDSKFKLKKKIDMFHGVWKKLG